MKNKLLICFRPVTIETDDTEPIIHSDHHHHRVSKWLTVTNQINTETTSSFSDKDNLKITRHPRSIIDSSRQDLKTTLRRRRACDRNIDPLMLRTKSRDYPKLVELNSCPRSVSERIDCLSASLNKSLSRSGSLSKSFNKKKQSISDDEVRRSWNSGLVLFVTSMCVTVFWGRVWGILFISILLYFLPRRTCTDQRSENISKVAETEDEYKKRVIMEGLLERNHQRLRRRAINF